MKRFIFIISAAACVLASCIKEAPVGTNGTKVTATVESELTKTVLGEKDGASWPVLWQAGDKIDINGNESAPLAEGGDITAEFSFEAQLTAPFNAIYPASAATGIGTGEIPATHDYTADSFDPDAGVLLGTGNAEGVSFKHAMAYIAFVPQGDGATITSLELTAVGGEKLSGAFTTDYSTLTMSGEASSKVTVNCSTPVALGNEIIAAIPAQTYTQGFKVKFTDSEGGSMEKTAAGSFTAAAGHIYTTTLPYAADRVIPTVVYLAGDPLDWKWTDQGRIDGVDGVFEITCNLNFTFEDAPYDGFKLFGANAEGYMDWDVAYGMDPNSTKEDISFDLVSNIGGDPQFYLKNLGYDSGRYTLTFDFNTMKLTVKPEATYPTSIRIYGDPFEWGWNHDDPKSIINGTDGVFNITTYLDLSWENETGQGFKFVDNSTGVQDWNKEYAMRPDATADNIGFDLKSVVGDNQIYLKPFGFTSGTYTITIDFSTMKVTLTEADPIYLYGAAFADYTDWTDWIPVPSVAEDVYETTLNLNVGDSEYARGFKIYKAQEDWANEYCMYLDSTPDNIRFGHKDDTGDNQVIPFNVGYTQSGNYVVRIDFNTMKITFTKVD